MILCNYEMMKSTNSSFFVFILSFYKIFEFYWLVYKIFEFSNIILTTKLNNVQNLSMENWTRKMPKHNNLFFLYVLKKHHQYEDIIYIFKFHYLHLSFIYLYIYILVLFVCIIVQFRFHYIYWMIQISISIGMTTIS